MGDVRVEMRELYDLRDRLQKTAAGSAEKEAFFASCANELAARLYAKVVKRTPVGDYSDTYDIKDDGEKKILVVSDKQGGALRKGWEIGKVRREGDRIVIEVSNEELYASYVEYGHQQTPGRYVPAIGKCLKKSWVPGQMMLTISTQEIREAAPKIMQKKLEIWLKEVFGHD